MQYIQLIPNWQSLTSEEALAYLLETTEISRRGRLSYQGIAEIAGTEFAAGVLMFFEQAIAEAASPAEAAVLRAELSSFVIGSVDGKTGGLDFSNSQRRAQIQAMIEAAAVREDWASPEQQAQVIGILQTLLNLGITYGPLWQKLGLSEEPTLEQVTRDLAVSKFVASKAIEYNEAQARVAVAIDNGATFSEVQTAWAGE